MEFAWSLHDCVVVDENITIMRRTRDRLTHSLVHDLHRQIFRPAHLAEQVAALETRELLKK